MPKADEPKAVLMRKGTEIRDERGNVVAKLARDVVTGQVVMPGDFEFMDGRELVVGDPIPEPIVQFLQTASTFKEPKTQ